MSTSADPSGPEPRSPAARGLGFLVIAAASWGITWPVQKFLLSELPPFSMRAISSVAAILIGFALASVRGEALRVPRDQWRILVVASMLNYGLFSILTVLALVWLNASEAVIFTYTMPIWAALLAWLAYGERLTLWRALALGLGLAGIVTLVGAEPVAASWAKLPGFACGLAAAWLFALGTVLSKHRPPRLPPVAGVAWQVAIGALPPIALCLFEAPRLAAVTPLGWAALAYSATMPMIVAYLAWFRALQLLPAATASIGTLIAPVVGVSGSALLLGEPIGVRQAAALAFTLAGMTLAVRGASASEPARQKRPATGSPPRPAAS